MNALDELTLLPTRKENPYVQAWRADGGRVVGFVCDYVPEMVAGKEMASAKILVVK